MGYPYDRMCLWKKLYLRGGTSFNGGNLLPESDLNDCIVCGSACDFYVPYTDDRKELRLHIRRKLARTGDNHSAILPETKS